MRVNINQNINFGRVVPINYTPLSATKKNNAPDVAFNEINDILSSREPFFYSKEECENIRNFFHRKIEDYNGKNGAMIVKVNDVTALLTGDDAVEAKQIMRRSSHDLKILGNKSGAKAKRRQIASNANKRLDKLISEKLEDGRPGRAEASIDFISKARDKSDKKGEKLSDKEKLRFDAIKYCYSYSSKPVKSSRI